MGVRRGGRNVGVKATQGLGVVLKDPAVRPPQTPLSNACQTITAHSVAQGHQNLLEHSANVADLPSWAFRNVAPASHALHSTCSIRSADRCALPEQIHAVNAAIVILCSLFRNHSA